MKSASPSVKATLIEVLATRRASDELPALVAATVDDNAQVRGAAMSALGQIGSPEQIAQMLPGVLKAQKGGERDNAERNIAMICARIDSEDQRGTLIIEAAEIALGLAPGRNRKFAFEQFQEKHEAPERGPRFAGGMVMHPL